jgi:cytidine deaminase
MVSEIYSNLRQCNGSIDNDVCNARNFNVHFVFLDDSKLTDKFPSPCGGCRQIIAEFGYNSNCRVIMIKDSPSPPHVVKIMTIAELLPEAFLPDALNK